TSRSARRTSPAGDRGHSTHNPDAAAASGSPPLSSSGPRLAVDQIRRHDVLYGDADRFVEGDLVRRLPGRLEPHRLLAGLREDAARGDDVAGFERRGLA